MKNTPEIHEFFVEGGDQDRSHVLLHITEPGTPEEKAKGYFFALCEINNGPLEQIEHLQQMIDNLESGYYETDDQEDKNAFEITLEYLNRRGHHILQYKNTVINCLVGVLRGEELSFAYHGNPEALLFYRQQDETKIMNILENETPPADEQLFSSLLQGTLNAGDYFYIATPHVNDYFTADRVQKILVGRTTRQSSTHIQKVLKEINADYSFGGILFHYPDNNELMLSGQKIKNDNDIGSVASLNKLASQERSTEETLASPLLGVMKKKWRAWQANHKENEKKKHLLKIQEQRKKSLETKKHGTVETNFRTNEVKTNKNETILNTVLIALGKALVASAVLIYRFFRKLIPAIWYGLVGLLFLITNRDNRRQEIIKLIKNYFWNKSQELGRLPLISKILLLTTIILGLIFIGSLLTFKIKASVQAKNLAYQNLVQAITDKKTAAEANLIYNNNNQALTLLTEAKTMLTDLPNSSHNEKEKYQELNKAIEESLKKLRKMEIITPSLVYDLATLNLEPKALKLAVIDNQLIIYGPEDKNFYRLNPNTQQAIVKELVNTSNLTTASTPKEQDMIIFAMNDKEITMYNKDSNLFSPRDINFPTNEIKLADLSIYNRRLYSLNPSTNQIYKHNPTQTGFDKGTEWINDNVDIRDGVSLAVDGDIFVLTANNLLKFTAGKKQDFSISGLDPALDHPSQIWTYNGVNNIYIFEPTNKRLIILDKEGKLKIQYTANEWQSPTSMIVDEPGKTIFVLDNNKIWKFGL